MNIGLPYQRYTLTLPAGHVGVHFSTTIPCEIKKIEPDSPIIDESIEFLGRLAFHVCIPNKIEVVGALDKLTLESILAAYCNVPDRKILFKDRGERPDAEYFTTTVLPIGRIDVSFRSTNGLFPSRNRVFVERSGYSNFAFPIGHYVEKIIVPNKFESEGGIRTSKKLCQILDHFANVPGRKIVFSKNIPRGNIITKITLPKKHTGLNIYLKQGKDDRKLPIVTPSAVGCPTRELLAPVSHVIEKFIVPNIISTERMPCLIVRKLLNHYAEVEDRVIILREYYKDVPKAGSIVTITLPTGKLGVRFKSYSGNIWVSDVIEDSSIYWTCPTGYYVDSLLIPDEMELIGRDELKNAEFMVSKMMEFSHVDNRILVLKEHKQDVQNRANGTRFKREIV